MQRDGKAVSLTVTAGELARSVHANLECIDCHAGFDGQATPHQTPLKPVNCFGCHDTIAKSHSFHPDFAAKPFAVTLQTDCTECHGTHGIVEPRGAASPFAEAKLTQLCGRCHEEAVKHFSVSAHGVALAAGRPESPSCVSCHRSGVTRSSGDPLHVKLEQARLCLSCHLSNPRVVARSVMGAHFIESYGQSVHGAALNRGVATAANCVDCHGSHEMYRAMVAASHVNQRHIPETCARCHERAAKEYGIGVHGVAFERGNKDSPVCTDCHGEHSILLHSDPNAPVSPRNVSQMVCGSCHASVKLAQRYGVAADRFQTFADSYHGLATRGGSTEAVNCASCHGAHAIRNSADPLSPVNKVNIARTCGQCHPGANARFAVGSVHVSESSAKDDPIVYWIARLYTWLIFLVVGGMALHNALLFAKKIRQKIKVQRGIVVEPEMPHRLHLRMTVHERLQHGALMVSFIALVITGFMLRFPDVWWVVAIRRWSDHLFMWRGLIHRTAAVAMVAGGVWHLFYLAFTVRGRQLLRDLWPKIQDATDAVSVLRYNLGLTPTKPKFGRFSYIEKAEYWALIWGSVIMTATGAFLWFENTAIGLFSKHGYDISRVIHFYEAVLATLAIIVWHFYFVIFNPDVYPMNLAWLTGRMSEQEMLEEHPAELERLQAIEAAKAQNTPPTPPAAQPPA